MADISVASEQLTAAEPLSGRASGWVESVVVYGLAVASTLVVGGFVLAAIGADPIDAYSTMYDASLGSRSALALTLNKTTPLLLGGVAVAFALRAGFINLGVDGQIYLGATFATGAAYALADGSAATIIPIALVAGAVGGMGLGLVAGVLRARWGVNELFVTVMLNFVAFYLVEWLTTGRWQDKITGEAVSRPIPAAAGLPRLIEHAHVGFVGALVVGVVCAVWLATSTRGFEFRAVGANPLAARFAGVNLLAVGVVALGVSGLIGGLAGAIEVLGVHRRLATGLSPNYGFMAVLIAVLARSRPSLVIPVSFAFGTLLVGSDALQGSVGLPAAAVLLFQALVVLAVILFGAVKPGSWVAAVVTRRRR